MNGSWGRLWKVSWIFLFLSFFHAHAGQVGFQASLQSEEVEENEMVAVDFVGEGDSLGMEMDEPKFDAPDFDVVNGFQRGTQVRSEFVNGSFSTKKSFSYSVVLRPKKTGKLKIGNITVKIDGKQYSARDLYVEVAAAGKLASNPRGSSKRQNLFGNLNRGFQARPQSEDIDEEEDAPSQKKQGNPNSVQSNAPTNRSLFMRTEPNKLKLYKGEELRVGYALYTRTQIAGIHVERFPTSNGFLKEEIDIPILQGPQNLNWKRTTMNGVEFMRGLVAEYALFALKEGTLPLDVFSGKISFRSRKALPGALGADDDPFGLNRFFQVFDVITETHESDRKTVEILPLPTQGQPEDFSGLVGNFNILAVVDKYNLREGESLNVKIKISGKGHAGSLEKLHISWPADFELYEDKSNTKYFKNGESERIFDYLVIPKTKGSFTLGPIKVSMFNPETKSYKTMEAEPIKIEVLEGHSVTAGPGDGGSKAAVLSEKTKEDIRYLLLDPQASSNARQYLVLAVKVLTVLSFLLSLLFLTLHLKKTFTPENSSEKYMLNLKRKLNSLDEAAAHSPVQTLGDVDLVLSEFLHFKHRVQKGSLTQSALIHSLKEKGLEGQEIENIKQLVDICENQRFLPLEMASDPEQAKKAVSLLKGIVAP